MQNKILEILRKEPNLLTNSITSRLDPQFNVLITTRMVRGELRKMQTLGLVDCKRCGHYKVQKLWYVI